MLADRRRWIIVGLLFALSAVNYLDRQTLSVLTHTLKHILHFSDVQYSYVVTAFLVAYTIGFAFGGRVIDKVGVRASVGYALAFWSGAAMLHALAGGWLGLAAFRLLLGLSESVTAPASARAMSEWIPQRERGFCMAISSTGFMVGALLAPPIVSVIALRFGWQWAFVVTGGLGFLLLAAWLKLYHAPENASFLGERERARIFAERGEQTGPEDIPLMRVLAHPLCWSLVVARFLTDPLSHFLTFWLPNYLQSSRHFSLAMIGLLGWIPFFAADVGGPGGGALSDVLIRAGVPPQRARLLLMFAAACIMPLALVAVRVEAAWLSLGLISVMMAAQSCWIVNLLTLLTDSFPRRQVATVVGLSGVGGSIGGIIATLISGEVIQAFGYVPVFTVFGFVHLAAFAILLSVFRRHGSLKRSDAPAQALAKS